MQVFKEHLSDIQPQLVSLVLVVIILTVASILIYRKLKKLKPNEAPKGVVLLTEQYVMGVETLFKSVAKDKISVVLPYIFTLFTFLLCGNLLGLIGFPAPVTSYSVPLVLGFIAWFGIYVTGTIYQKLHFYKKYLNPLDFIAQFSPFISISFRIFGNIIGGTTIMYLLYHVIGFVWSSIWTHVPGMAWLGMVNLLASMIAPPFHIYFDLFSGVVQAFIFTLLTIVYWAVEATAEEKHEKRRFKKKEVVVFHNQSSGPHKVRVA